MNSQYIANYGDIGRGFHDFFTLCFWRTQNTPSIQCIDDTVFSAYYCLYNYYVLLDVYCKRVTKALSSVTMHVYFHNEYI